MGPHSKGDDTRNAKELKKLNILDPLIKLRKKIKNSNLLEKTEKKAEQYILRLFDYSIKNKFSNKKKISKQDSINIIKKTNLKSIKAKKFGEYINKYFCDLLKENKKVLFFGEDIKDPYGGAFKITKNLTNKFPKNIYSTHISEASIVGMTSGLAVEGYKPIVEVMFGDFLSLAFDQILNNLSKFHFMYENFKTPIVIRTPMGGRRGYGPTHSQSIEKHFFGIKGLNIYSLNPFFPIDIIYNKALNDQTPSLVIENKVLYNFDLEKINSNKYKNFVFKNHYECNNFYTTFSLSEFEKDECTIICYGGMVDIVLNAALEFFLETEIAVKVVLISKLCPFENVNLINVITEKGPIITVEESGKFFGFGSEVGSYLTEKGILKSRDFLRLSSKDEIIPSSYHQEKEVLISQKDIVEALKNYFK